jgi:hypothetical protein
MNINTRSLLIAASVGAALQLVLGLLTQLGQFYVLQSRLADSSAAIAGLARYSAIAAAVTCLCGGASDLLVGALYGLVHPRARLNPGDGVLGGGAAGALARVVSGGAGLGISLLLLPLTYQRLQALSGGDLPAGAFGPALLVSALGGLIGGLAGIVFAAIFGAALAALTGGVAALLRSRAAD